MRIKVAPVDLRRRARRALSAGAESITPTFIKWDVASGCENSISMEYFCLPWADRPGSGLTLLMEVKCRKCGTCLRQRGHHWRLRCQTEFQNSQRTWFVTLTLRPDEQFKALSAARKRASARGEDYESMTPQRQFQGRVSAISPAITRWMKRVRKNSGAKLRYCIVSEAHKSGDPHFHVLLHECPSSPPVLHRHLTSWKLGFVNAKLANDANAAAYVTKYLSKSMLSRVRASILYGKSPPSPSIEDARCTTLDASLQPRLEGSQGKPPPFKTKF
jgi:hypothetical protein